jgi:hypothetical protein
MKSSLVSTIRSFHVFAIAVVAFVFASSALAQIAYDEAGNYVVTANWTNGANAGFGFTPWVFATNGPDSHGTYLQSLNVPAFVIASVTNVTGTNYTDVWGTFANGNTDVNETTVYRGFSNSLGTNTFKLQWGARGAGVTTTTNAGQVHGWCGFTLRNGNVTDSAADFQTGVRFYLYFLDGAAPSTLYVLDGSNGGFPVSIPGTSFSDLGRNNITNAIEAEVTPGADGNTYHLVLKDCVQNRIIYTLDSTFAGSGTIDSAALFCKETTGDQVYNRMQITSSTNIPPTVVNVQPTNGSIYLDANSVSISFEVDSFNSLVASNLTTVVLNGVIQSNVTYNTTDPTTQLTATCAAAIAPDTFYTLQIIAQDANGNIVTNTSTFNTFLATDLYIDAYDYNYTNGLFVDNSTPTNAYANLLGVQNVDYFDTDIFGTNNVYRPNDFPDVLNLDNAPTGDPVDHANLRQNGGTAYNIGFTDQGEWQNYTRTIPAPTNYSIYARAASAGGGQFEVERLANATATTVSQPLIALGRVNVPNTGGSKVFAGQLVPVTDIFGNTAVIPLSGVNTFRETAISSRGYNLEYFVVVAVTNATSKLRPYISVASPTPNAVGVGLNTSISMSIANRQTTVTPASIQMFLNASNQTSHLVLSNNAAGTLVNWAPTTNLVANSTNTIVVIYNDSDGVSTTNSWVFFTGTTGGALGNGVWSGGGGTNMFWSAAANWTGGTPGPGFNATFASAGATNNLSTNNIVSTNVTILGLYYNTNNLGYHTTWIQDGVTLTVTNSSTAIGAIVQVGGSTGGDNVFGNPVTNTITGQGGTLLVSGNSQASGLANQLNFQVRQSAVVPAPYLTTLDMSGLGTMMATVGKFYLAQGGGGGAQSNVSALVFMARTNVVTCLRPNAGQFEVGDSSGGLFTLPGSALNLGITNALFVDTMRIGKQKATNNLVRFNPAFTNLNPVAFIRGTNGLSTRLTTLTIGDADTETTVPNFVQGSVDFSGGKVDALIGALIIGRGETTTTDTGFAQGTLTVSAGTVDALNVTNGMQRGTHTATETGVINVNGTATLASTNIVLAQTNGGPNTSLVTGTLNVTNGTVRGNIFAGGGVSTLNLIGGTLVVSNSAGTAAKPLSVLNIANASLHLKVDGSAPAAKINAAAVSASGTTTITIDSVANVAGPTLIHLLTYTGSDPFAGLSLAPLPLGFTGTLADNAGSVDLNVNVSQIPPSPTIQNIFASGGQVVLSGTNNNGAGGTYKVLTSTNVALPVTNWTLVTSGTFDANGNFASTNSAATNKQQFFMLQVP